MAQSQQPQQPENRWLSAMPKLRSDLVFAPRPVRDRDGYILEDTTRGKFFRLGLAEYAFIAALDGTTTVLDAIERGRQSVDQPLTPQSAAAILNWLASAGLLEQTARAAAESSTRTLQKAAWWQNPIYIRIPLVAPDPILDRLAPYMSWIGSKWTLMATVILTVISSLVVLPNADLLVGSLHSVFSPGGSLTLVLSWVVLKVLHEMGHGLVCRRYGASSREAGVMLLLFMPIPYIDVTSSWRLGDRRQRIHIAAAGVLVELLVASLASFVWIATEPGVSHQLAANVVLMASITTILFNANPLMRFDGYYILSDALDVPNLYGQCQGWLRSTLRRRLLGLPAPAQQLPPRLATFMRVYAVSALFWRMSVYAGILIAAALLWEGAGVVLAAFAVITWFAIPIVRWVRSTFGGQEGNSRPNMARLAVVLGGGVALIAMVGLALPWPGAAASAAVVDYAPMWVLRAPADAWVERLFIQSGQYVEKGAVLAELRNEDLDLDAARLRVHIQRTALVVSQLEKEGRNAEAQAQRERQRGFEEQLEELQKQRELLYIRAPAAGRVVSPRVGDLLGTYARKGQELVSIGNERKKEVLIAATQDDLDKLSHRVGLPVRIATAGGDSIVGRLERVKPRASTRPLHAALTAAAGGPLTVERVAANSRDEAKDDVKLLQPYFEAVVPLAPAAAERLAAGQTVRVYLNAGRDSIAAHFWKSATSWFRKRTR